MKKITPVFLILFIVLASCNFQQKKAAQQQAAKNDSGKISIPGFNADSAYGFVEKQVSF